MVEVVDGARLPRVVIVGAGQAGAQVAFSLRDEGFEGPITLIGAEAELPYGRPALSKAFLLGKVDRRELSLRGTGVYASRTIAVVTDTTIEAIDRPARLVRAWDGRVFAYDHLVLATGARSRALSAPGASQAGILQLRTAEDAERLKRALPGARRIVIVGAGFIGLEFAAVAATTGCDVTVLEAADRPLARAVSRPLSDFLATHHEKAGIRFAFGTTVERLAGDGTRVTGVVTSGGDPIAADLVLVGIGVLPNAELAAAAGLAVENGIVVDDHLATSDPAVSAVGDCAAYPQPHAGGSLMRLESVQNAVDHARCLARRLTGRAEPYRAVPWFWSEQGAVKLQIAGLAVPHDRAVLRGDPEAGAFSVFCFRAGRLVGVESVNRPAEHIAARRILSDAIPLLPDEAADRDFDLRMRAGATLRAA